ncbi:MAG: TetR/AcrR family transcriptional regulator [Pseudomonadota bacterium]
MSEVPGHLPPLPSEGARAILAAAEGLFASRGYDAVSMNEIARAAGVSKANVFHHFSTKRTLYLEVLRSACANDSADLLDELEQQAGPVVERLQRFVTHHLASLLRNERSARLIQREVRQSSDECAKELAEQVFGDNFLRLLHLIKAGQHQGELRQDVEPALIAVLLLAGNLFFFDARRVLRHLPETGFADDPAEFNRRAMALLLHGIQPPAA